MVFSKGLAAVFVLSGGAFILRLGFGIRDIGHSIIARKGVGLVVEVRANTPNFVTHVLVSQIKDLRPVVTVLDRWLTGLLERADMVLSLGISCT